MFVPRADLIVRNGMVSVLNVENGILLKSLRFQVFKVLKNHHSQKRIMEPFPHKQPRLKGFQRVLGGEEGSQGIVPGSIILLSGDPGVGKSTVLLQIAFNLARTGKKILYISGEESDGQIRLRAERISSKKALPEEFFLFANTKIEEITQVIGQNEFDLVILDSIQTVSSEYVPGFPGSVAQIRGARHKRWNCCRSHDALSHGRHCLIS